MFATERDRAATTLLPYSSQAAGFDDRPSDAERLEARLRAWRPLYRPCTAEEEWLFGLLVSSALRVEECMAHQIALKDHASERANLAWEIDRACEAEELALKLERRPGATVARLRSFKQGAEALLSRWKMLQRVLDRGERWDEDQASMALDLLGISPKGRSDAPWDRDPEDAHRIARVEIADLERIIAGHLALLDDFERTTAAEGEPVAVPDALKAIRREEAAALRTFQWARQLLLSPGNPAPRISTRAAHQALAEHPADDLADEIEFGNDDEFDDEDTPDDEAPPVVTAPRLPRTTSPPADRPTIATPAASAAPAPAAVPVNAAPSESGPSRRDRRAARKRQRQARKRR